MISLSLSYNCSFCFQDYDRLLITTWGHDPGVIATSNILLTLNDALSHSAILVQVWIYSVRILY